MSEKENTNDISIKIPKKRGRKPKSESKTVSEVLEKQTKK